MNTPSNSHYLNGLTWLRAIAALFVVVSHSMRTAEPQYNEAGSMSVPNFMNFFDLGSFGVLLFFTLSGTTLFISVNNRPVSHVQFFIKRFFRIWPAFVVALVAYVLFRWIFAVYYPAVNGNWIEEQFVAPFTGLDVLSYLTLTSNLFAPTGLFNNAFWSLPVEFQYYLCFPVLFYLVKKFGAIGPLLVGLFFFAVYKFKLVTIPDNKVFMLAYSFCFGVIIGYYYSVKNLRFNIKFSGLLLFLVFVVAAIVTIYPSVMPDFPIISGIWNWYIVLSAVAVVLVLFSEPKLPQNIHKVLMRLGETSYSLYLWHNLVLAALLMVFIQFDFIQGGLPFWLLFGFTLVLTIAISELSYEKIEKPGIALGKKFGGMFQLKPVKST